MVDNPVNAGFFYIIINVVKDIYHDINDYILYLIEKKYPTRASF